MAKTVLQLLQEIANELGIDEPKSLVNTRHRLTKQLLANLYRAAQIARDKVAFSELNKTLVVPLVAGQSQYKFPADFDYELFDTHYDNNDKQKVYGVITPQEWQQYKYGYLTTLPFSRYRVKGYKCRKLTVSPTPSQTHDGNFIVLEYQSKQWILPPEWEANKTYFSGSYVNYGNHVYKYNNTDANRTSGTIPPIHETGIASDGSIDWILSEDSYDRVMTNDDIFLLPEQVLSIGTQMLWRARKSLPFQIESGLFQSTLDRAKVNSLSAGELYLDGCRRQETGLSSNVISASQTVAPEPVIEDEVVEDEVVEDETVEDENTGGNEGGETGDDDQSSGDEGDSGTSGDTNTGASGDPEGLLFESNFEDADLSCWSNFPNGGDNGGFNLAGCNGFSSFGQGDVIALKTDGKGCTGSNYLETTYSNDEDFGLAEVTKDKNGNDLNEDHIFTRFYESYDEDYDFGHGNKTHRISSFNEETQLNNWDIVATSWIDLNPNGRAGKNDNYFEQMNYNGGALLHPSGQNPTGGTWEPPTNFINIERGRRYCMEYEIKLNTINADGSFNFDGEIRAWRDDVLVMEVLNAAIRDNAEHKVNRVGFGGWYTNGGVDPVNPSIRRIDNVAINTSRIGDNIVCTADGTTGQNDDDTGSTGGDTGSSDDSGNGDGFTELDTANLIAETNFDNNGTGFLDPNMWSDIGGITKFNDAFYTDENKFELPDGVSASEAGDSNFAAHYFLPQGTATEQTPLLLQRAENFTERFIRWKEFYKSPFAWADSQAIFRFGSDSSTKGGKVDVNFAGGQGLITYDKGGIDRIFESFMPPNVINNWNEIENQLVVYDAYIKKPSQIGANDGRFALWINETLIVNINIDMNDSGDFTYFEIGGFSAWNGASSGSTTVNPDLHRYILGKIQVFSGLPSNVTLPNP